MKVNFSKALKGLSKWAVRHQPELMHALGFAAGASALVLTATGTAKTVREYDERMADEEKPEPTKAEVAKIAVKNYIPAAIAATSAVVFHTMGIKSYIKRNAMLTAYAMNMYDRLTKIEEKNVEILGEKKAKEIQDAVAVEDVKHMDLTGFKETGHGTCRFIDKWNGQKIMTSATYVHELINRYNEGILNQMAMERGEYIPAGKTCHYPSVYNWEMDMGEEVTDFGQHMGWFDGTLIHAHISYEKHESGEPIGFIQFAAASMPKINPNRLYTHGYS